MGMVVCAFGSWCADRADGVQKQEPPAQAGTPATGDAGRQECLRRRDAFGQQVVKLRQAGKLKEAIEAAEKMLGVERAILAELKSSGRAEESRRMQLDVVGSLLLIAEMHEELQTPKQQPDFAPTRKARREAVNILAEICPPGHPEHYWLTDAEVALSDVARLEKLSREDRLLLREVYSLNTRIHQLWQTRKSRQWRVSGSREAVKLAQRSVDINRRILGQNHPSYALSLFNLAAQYGALSQFERAEPLDRQALEIRKKVLGEKHPFYASSLQGLGVLYQKMGDYERAEPLLRQALAIGDRHLEATFAVQNERQRLAYVARVRHLLDGWLTVAPRAEVPAEQLHASVLRWKGAVLARRSSAYRQARGLAQLRPRELARQLPPGTVLVDFFVYTYSRPLKEKKGKVEYERRILAFVLRRQSEPVFSLVSPSGLSRR